MNKLLISVLLAAVISGCNKTGNTDSTATDDPVPTADFKITNTVANETVLEGSTIEFQNNSKNGDSFEWDFGSSMVSSERTPVGIVLRNCARTQEIRLVVRTRRGRSATQVRTITIRCR